MVGSSSCPLIIQRKRKEESGGRVENVVTNKIKEPTFNHSE